MRLHARNIILEKDSADQKAIPHIRKHHLSDKWRIIDEKHSMMGAELIGIRVEQETTKQRKAPKKGTGKRKGRSKAKKESSDESEAHVDITDDNEVEIFDSIEV